ncbi:MAG: hypothetical protein JSS34_04880 [Proteobacteria bacterium]|nr:hypothetical protein [Pseudomonadota bacterium]
MTHKIKHKSETTKKDASKNHAKDLFNIIIEDASTITKGGAPSGDFDDPYMPKPWTYNW